MPRSHYSPEKSSVARSVKECGAPRSLSRRAVLKSALGVGVGLQFIGRAVEAADDLRRARPQTDDFLVFSLGSRQGQIITLQDLPPGGPPIVAYPMEPQTQTIRDGSRLNQVLLVRFSQEELTEQTRVGAVEGVVGYSAVCTHTGCDVSGWKTETKYFICSCHASAFNPKDRARVVGGPAPRPLAALPLRVVDGKVTVAGPFAGRVGAIQK